MTARTSRMPVVLFTAALACMLSWKAPAAPAGPCPDLVAAIEQAEDAMSHNDIDALAEQISVAQRGISCGPIMSSGRIRARFWLALAVMLDASGDRPSTDDALFAAWRAWPDVPINRLSARLQDRYAETTDRPTDDAAFKLLPLPDRDAIIYVDGTATSAEQLHSSLEADASVRSKAGLHILQLAENIDATHASAGGVKDLQANETEVFNIRELSLFGAARSDMSIPGSLGRDHPSGGCAAHR